MSETPVYNPDNAAQGAPEAFDELARMRVENAAAAEKAQADRLAALQAEQAPLAGTEAAPPATVDTPESEQQAA